MTDDLAGLSPNQVKSVVEWRQFYEKEDKYPFVGYLVGRYFDSGGVPTTATADLVSQLEEVERLEAIQEVGMFGNQNTVCKPVTPTWRTTVERLKAVFLR